MTVEGGARVDTAGVARAVAARADEIVGSMVDLLEASVEGEPLTHPGRRRRTMRMAAGFLERQLDELAGAMRLPISCPPPVAEAARAAVAMELSHADVAHCYRAAHAALWSAWLEAVAESGRGPAEVHALLEQGARFMFAFTDRCIYFLEREHERERRRVRRSDARRRAVAVVGLLTGAAVDAPDLGYALDQDHLAVLVDDPEGLDPVRPLAAALGAELLEVQAEQPDRRWAWLGRRRPFAAQDMGVVRRTVAPESARLAVGAPARGLAGFRASHFQAVIAHRVAARRPAATLTVYEDVAVEGLALADPSTARAFLDRELRGLDDDDDRTETLRETLGAYFASAQNAASTAARIGVSERTIANRLRAIEERLGCSIVARRAELETALRLRPLLTPPAPEPGRRPPPAPPRPAAAR
ncbi:MAG TPA: helix-turn-helix domain-containing protein [Solirubrobacteraceae bacterium]|nr:helix-turn-helix domain-containing protein [Solirubrobacteraceae bacterium]